MGIYMGGRQNFETSQEVHKREEDNKSNKQVIAKVLIQMSLIIICVILVKRIPVMVLLTVQLFGAQKKITQNGSIETQYNSGWFVWAVPPLRTWGNNHGYGEEWCRMLPTWVLF
jgi:hypothetical protein